MLNHCPETPSCASNNVPNIRVDHCARYQRLKALPLPERAAAVARQLLNDLDWIIPMVYELKDQHSAQSVAADELRRVLGELRDSRSRLYYANHMLNPARHSNADIDPDNTTDQALARALA